MRSWILLFLLIASTSAYFLKRHRRGYGVYGSHESNERFGRRPIWGKGRLLRRGYGRGYGRKGYKQRGCNRGYGQSYSSYGTYGGHRGVYKPVSSCSYGLSGGHSHGHKVHRGYTQFVARPVFDHSNEYTSFKKPVGAVGYVGAIPISHSSSGYGTYGHGSYGHIKKGLQGGYTQVHVSRFPIRAYLVSSQELKGNLGGIRVPIVTTSKSGNIHYQKPVKVHGNLGGFKASTPISSYTTYLSSSENDKSSQTYFTGGSNIQSVNSHSQFQGGSFPSGYGGHSGKIPISNIQSSFERK